MCWRASRSPRSSTLTPRSPCAGAGSAGDIGHDEAPPRPWVDEGAGRTCVRSERQDALERGREVGAFVGTWGWSRRDQA